MDFLSELRVTSSTSKSPGVSNFALPPVAATEYRWLRPSCSDANTILPSAAKLREASSVSSGRESSSFCPLSHSLFPEPVPASAIHNDHGFGRIGISGSLFSSPAVRTNTIHLPSGDQRGMESLSTPGARYRIELAPKS